MKQFSIVLSSHPITLTKLWITKLSGYWCKQNLEKWTKFILNFRFIYLAREHIAHNKYLRKSYFEGK